ncbi:M15 family metallopeptidase [Psychroflexus aestuariivivens]|uniref:M15 family metallopeptidase n=1 Tax=Psychroflexus aestuariivivens TaxID=1795040 RepID=UPI0019618793|nr:M15 family metallopeptidase [Psychroflexus aestuariivivens]
MSVRLLVILLWLCVFSNIGFAQEKNKYGVRVMNDIEDYRKKMKADEKYKLVNLRNIDGIQFDIRYATTNNFVEQKVYPSADAFARKAVAEALSQIQDTLESLGLGLKIFDAYRPYEATVKFYESVEDTTYVASPFSGSRHNRGCAVDLTLVDLKSGKPLEMPTEYDDFTKKAHPNYMDLSQQVLANRKLLIDVMQAHGFKVYPYEWWHFDYVGWEENPLMNLSFEDLRNQ